MAVIGDGVAEGGRGTKLAGIGDADTCRDNGIGDPVFERGRGIVSAG